MTEMTVLHFASPFAFSAPVTESRSSQSIDHNGKAPRQETGQDPAEPGVNRNSGTRDSTLVDARDARSALMRNVDLASSPADLNAVSASVDAVLAAYQQDVSVAGDDANGPGSE